MVILNDGWRELPYSCTEWLRGYKKLYFTQLFRDFVFELPSDAKPQHPELKDMNDSLQELFQKNGLIKGKTVVISPFQIHCLICRRTFGVIFQKAYWKKAIAYARIVDVTQSSQ